MTIENHHRNSGFTHQWWFSGMLVITTGLNLHFPMAFPMVFLWFSHFPLGFLWFPLWFFHFSMVSYGFNMIFHHVPMIFPFSYGFPILFPWLSHGIPRGFSHGSTVARSGRWSARWRPCKVWMGPLPTKDAPGTPWTVDGGRALGSVDSWLIYGERMFMVNIWLIYIYIYIYGWYDMIHIYIYNMVNTLW